MEILSLLANQLTEDLLDRMRSEIVEADTVSGEGDSHVTFIS